MMNKLKLYGLVMLLALSIGSACASTAKKTKQDPFQPSAEQASQAQLPLETLQEGLALYQSRCGGCHMMYPPEYTSAEAWPEWVEKMSERAKLSPDQAQKITQYLVAMSQAK